MPLIHLFTHTFTHQRRLAAMQGINQLVRSIWGLGVLLKDTSTRPGWDRTGNPPTARWQLLPPEPYRPVSQINVACCWIEQLCMRNCCSLKLNAWNCFVQKQLAFAPRKLYSLFYFFCCQLSLCFFFLTRYCIRQLVMADLSKWCDCLGNTVDKNCCKSESTGVPASQCEC